MSCKWKGFCHIVVWIWLAPMRERGNKFNIRDLNLERSDVYCLLIHAKDRSLLELRPLDYIGIQRDQ
ncbi:hypothetical protein BZG74_09740 [Salinivibrio sharmensis]|uniref:Uncharacterized protein n=1 Tax=Salinivibrio sharmensis TaxID=390883 RepID=A0ABX3KGG7_9GAMM|nr:hypothetical protein BZG74_09740 [Salinivibrio sharmensis]